MRSRRQVLIALGIGALAVSRTPFAQQQKTARRVAVLGVGTREAEDAILKPFYDGMRELGWIEGRNVSYDRVYANNDHARLSTLAAELVARKPDVIYAPPNPAALAAKKATRTIPIVFGSGRDVVAAGLVESLARPGSNVTGITTIGNELGPKRLQLIRELLPNVRRVGVIFTNSELVARLEKQSIEATHKKLGLGMVFAEASTSAQIEPAVKALAKSRVEAVYFTNATMFFHERKRLIGLCKELKLPVFGTLKEWAEDGAIASYGTNLAEQLRHSAYVMDKVLKGTKPADIPVEQPTVFELVINLKSARALDLEIPRVLLQRADRVIE